MVSEGGATNGFVLALDKIGGHFRATGGAMGSCFSPNRIKLRFGRGVPAGSATGTEHFGPGQQHAFPARIVACQGAGSTRPTIRR